MINIITISYMKRIEKACFTNFRFYTWSRHVLKANWLCQFEEPLKQSNLSLKKGCLYMANTKNYQFGTKVIHSGQKTEDWNGASLPPIYQSAAHSHMTAQNLSDSFAGQTGDHIYMRLSNPTNNVLQDKIADLEGGAAAIAVSSGMAAVSGACMTLLRAGDELVASRSLFVSTYLLFTNILPQYGISAHLTDMTDLAAVAEAITAKTRLLYFETIGNPAMDVPDIKALAELAHSHGIPLVVDNTLASPYLCRPIEHGADIVFHSTTKYLSGHGNAIGGIVVDAGKFNWETEKFSDFSAFVERKGVLAFTDRLWREHHIHFGTTMAPFHAWLTMIGLDTLEVRMARHMENAMAVAEFLAAHPKVSWVNYSGLESNPCHETAKHIFGNKGFGGVLGFGLADQKECFKMIDHLDLIYNLANLGDCKTLIIHPYSSQFISFTEEKKKELGITPDLLRLSVGIESSEDIIADLEQALEI
ncbi:aminotransferase class I/II-fold pyridoxal phosphate-dependent enzyme [Desulfobacterales bacterium HSG17]|nr:aminotransferase class I/II-fold pyridoxal phosphate-dependent enzyme [Desulfobacterales bacterium HSG17]